MRNRTAEQYVSDLDLRRQKGMLEYWNLGVATLVFKKSVPDRLQAYSAELQRSTWSYSLFTLRERFVDVGYLGAWRFFARSIEDYDISE